MLAILLTLSPALGQDSGVQAEALNQANLRAGPGTDFPVVGQIQSGTKYPVIGRSGRFPWYLIQLPDRQGWVYKDLVNITGDINTVPITENVVATLVPAESPAASPPAQPTESTPNAPTAPQPTVIVIPAESATPTPTFAPTRQLAVYAEAKSEANVRYGPGTDFLVIGRIYPGQLYAVLHRHTTFDKWIEIAYAEVAGGRGWVHLETVNLTGNIDTVPTTSVTNYGYPTLTPTAFMVVTSIPPWTGTAPAATQLAVTGNVSLEALTNEIYNYLLSKEYIPASPKQGSVFLMDLQTGQSFTANPNIAYSAVSVMKVPVMVAFYRKFATAPTAEQARLLAEMIMCSENLSSNRILSIIGDGDEQRGALYVTETMKALDLKNTFLTRSFFTGAVTNGPTPTDQPFIPVNTEADQRSAEPDPSSQSTAADIGYLLAEIYQCSLDGSGPLTAAFPGELDMTDCRRMTRLLAANKIGSMLEAGVPQGVIVAHKHGWADSQRGSTHGDAAVIITPGGNYVLTIFLNTNTQRLQYDASFPVIAEVSRMVYNAYNPGQPMAQINLKPVPECSFDTINALDPQLITDLQGSNLPPLR